MGEKEDGERGSLLLGGLIRSPADALGLDVKMMFGLCLEMFFDHLWRDADDMLTLPILD